MHFKQTETKQGLKAELLYLSSKYTVHKRFLVPALGLGSDMNQQSQSTRNIGIIFDSTLTMLHRVNSVCKSAFYHLRNISRIRKFVSSTITEILVHAFVSSKLDYCNSLLYNIRKYTIKKLQSIQNAATLVCSRKYDRSTPVLVDLHWLPVFERINLTFSSYCLPSMPYNYSPPPIFKIW